MLTNDVVARRAHTSEQALEAALHRLSLVGDMLAQQQKASLRVGIDVDRLNVNAAHRRTARRIDDDRMAASLEPLRKIDEKNVVAIRLRVGQRRDERCNDAD